MRRFFTSESVTEGHPDKVCDRISDSILDALLREDEFSRAAVECCASYDTLFITGEVTSRAKVDYEAIARDAIRRIGYTKGPFAYDACRIIERIHGQSPDIALGVDSSMENKAGGSGDDLLGAGDQGVIALGGAEVLGRAGQPAGVVGREQAGADEQEEQQEEAQAAGTAGGGGGLWLKHGGRATARGCAAMIDRSERTAGSLAFSETTQSPRRRQVPIPRPVSAGGGRRDGRREAPCGNGG